MLISRKELPILTVNVIYILVFTPLALKRANYEFVLYAAVVIGLAVLILLRQRRIQFDRTVLWGLTIWGFFHMAGGNVRVASGVLYELQLIPSLLRFDQLVHFFGFGVATLVCEHLLRPRLRPDAYGSTTTYGLIVLMGCGVGALNEILEFVAVLVVPETGVGGYENTLWDLVFNLGGAIAAVLIIARRTPETNGEDDTIKTESSELP